MIVEALKLQLLALTPEEKSQVVQWLVQSLVNNWQGISKTPNVMGGDACIRETRIPAWLLVSYRQSGKRDAEILAAYRRQILPMLGRMRLLFQTRLRSQFKNKKTLMSC